MALLAVNLTNNCCGSGKHRAWLDSREAAKAQRRSVLPQPLGAFASSREKFASVELKARWRGIELAA